MYFIRFRLRIIKFTGITSTPLTCILLNYLNLYCVASTPLTQVLYSCIYFFQHFQHTYHSMYYIHTVYLQHLQHEIKQRKMNLHLCIFYLKVTPHTHPPCTWIYAHPCKTVHNLKNHLICKSQIFPIPVTPNSPCQLDVTGVNCDSPGMNCQDVCISQQPNKIIFCCLMEGFDSPLCPPHGALLSEEMTPFPLLICHLRWGIKVVPFVELSYHDFLNEPGIIMQYIICVQYMYSFRHL